MATATLQDGRKIRFPDGLPPDQVKMIIQKATGNAVAPRADNGAPQTPGIMKAIGTGLVKGTAAIPGAIGDVPDLMEDFASASIGALTGRTGEEVQSQEEQLRQKLKDAGYPMIPKPGELINTQKILGWLKSLGVELPEAQTDAEKWVETIASFAPSAIAGGGTLKQKIAQTFIPGAATEGGGRVATEFAGEENEGVGRFLSGLIAALTTHAVTRRDVPQKMTADAAPNLTEPQLLAAEKLMKEAQAQGIPLTIPEAIQQVTGSGTRLADLQRVVEQTPKGGEVMRDFYAPRPGAVAQAGARQMDQIAPAPLLPEVLGTRVNTAAKGDIEGVNRAINNRTRALYGRAANDIVSSPALNAPAVIEAIKTIRSDPVLGPKFAPYADNSVAVIDAAQKIMKSQAEALNTPGQGLNRYKSSLISSDRAAAKGDARQQSPSYDAALNEQRRLREGALTPLQEGPTGKLAATADVGQQTRAAFPARPQAGSEQGVGRAVAGVGKKDPAAAAGLVRQHLETVFAEATQKNMGGPNLFGGAKFAAAIVGNPQQRKNLFEAVRALPNGIERWNGMKKFLQVLEATGQRQAAGSATAFNAQIMKELEGGKIGGEAAAALASPQKVLTMVFDKYRQYRLGKGSADLARLFTEGDINDLRAIIRHKSGSPQASAAAIRLLGQLSVASAPTD